MAERPARSGHGAPDPPSIAADWRDHTGSRNRRRQSPKADARGPAAAIPGAGAASPASPPAAAKQEGGGEGVRWQRCVSLRGEDARRRRAREAPDWRSAGRANREPGQRRETGEMGWRRLAHEMGWRRLGEIQTYISGSASCCLNNTMFSCLIFYHGEERHLNNAGVKSARPCDSYPAD